MGRNPLPIAFACLALGAGVSHGWVFDDFASESVDSGDENRVRGLVLRDVVAGDRSTAELVRSAGGIRFSFQLDGNNYPGTGFLLHRPAWEGFSLSPDDTIQFRVRSEVEACVVGGAGVCIVRFLVHSEYSNAQGSYVDEAKKGASLCHHLRDMNKESIAFDGSWQTLRIPARSLVANHWVPSPWIDQHRDSILAHLKGLQFWINGDGDFERASSGYLDLDDIEIFPARSGGTSTSHPTDTVGVVVRRFEWTENGLDGSMGSGDDSSKAVLTLDSIHPISGRSSARLDYELSPRATLYPWVTAVLYQGPGSDLRKARGIRVKFRSDAERQIEVILTSPWYPLPHAVASAQYQWIFNLRKGDLDTVLYFADASIPSWARNERLATATPPIETILRNVSGIHFNIRPPKMPTSTAWTGSVLMDDLTIVGADSLPAGIPPPILVLRHREMDPPGPHPDSIPSYWSWASPGTSLRLTHNAGLKAAWGKADFRCDFHFADPTGVPYGAFAGFGLGLRGDSAWDLRGIERLEFAENTPEPALRIRVHLRSNRYPQELVDSGVTYGWDVVLRSTVRAVEAHSLRTDSLRYPAWAASRKRLLAMLPPVDSVLKGVTGIEFSPQAEFLATGELISSKAQGYFQLNNIQVFGIDRWVPSPKVVQIPTSLSRHESARPWRIMSGNLLMNGSSSTLVIRGVNGRSKAILAPGSRYRLSSGVYTISAGDISRLVTVP